MVYVHCKPKPCKAYRELPVSQFSQGKTCFHYREPCSHCRDPAFIRGISLQNPVLLCTGLQCNSIQYGYVLAKQNVLRAEHNKLAVWPRLDSKKAS